MKPGQNVRYFLEGAERAALIVSSQPTGEANLVVFGATPYEPTIQRKEKVSAKQDSKNLKEYWEPVPEAEEERLWSAIEGLHKKLEDTPPLPKDIEVMRKDLKALSEKLSKLEQLETQVGLQSKELADLRSELKALTESKPTPEPKPALEHKVKK